MIVPGGMFLGWLERDCYPWETTTTNWNHLLLNHSWVTIPNVFWFKYSANHKGVITKIGNRVNCAFQLDTYILVSYKFVLYTIFLSFFKQSLWHWAIQNTDRILAFLLCHVLYPDQPTSNIDTWLIEGKKTPKKCTSSELCTMNWMNMTSTLHSKHIFIYNKQCI